MGRKQKSKTPQPQKGPRAQVQGMQKPQSAPGPNKHGKKAGNQTPMKPGGKLFQNGGNTPAQTKATPKAGDKRKLDSSLVASQPAKKPNTPLIVSAKGKNTPAKSPKIPPQLMKTPGGKKTPQAKTPAFAAKAKKTPQKPASDDDEDDDDDDDDEDIDFENIVFGSGSDDDEEDDESLEEDMDDDDDDEEEESEQSLKKAIDASVKRGVKTANKMDESDDDDDDEDDDVDIAAMAGGASSDDDEVDDDDDDDDDEDEDDDDRDVDIDEVQSLLRETAEALWVYRKFWVPDDENENLMNNDDDDDDADDDVDVDVVNDDEEDGDSDFLPEREECIKNRKEVKPLEDYDDESDGDFNNFEDLEEDIGDEVLPLRQAADASEANRMMRVSDDEKENLLIDDDDDVDVDDINDDEKDGNGDFLSETEECIKSRKQVKPLEDCDYGSGGDFKNFEDLEEDIGDEVLPLRQAADASEANRMMRVSDDDKENLLIDDDDDVDVDDINDDEEDGNGDFLSETEECIKSRKQVKPLEDCDESDGDFNNFEDLEEDIHVDDVLPLRQAADASEANRMMRVSDDDKENLLIDDDVDVDDINDDEKDGNGDFLSETEECIKSRKQVEPLEDCDDESDGDFKNFEDLEEDIHVDEDAVLKSIQNQQKAADKSSQKQQKQPEASKQKQKAETKPPQQKKAEQSKQAAGGKQKGQEKPQPSAQAANKKQEKKGEKKGKVADASGDAQRKEDRDKRTLFVKNLGPDTTTKDIKNLSKDIVDVRLRITIRGKGKERKKLGYAFVEFGSEAQADKNFKVLEGAKVKGNNLVVDFVGQKSSFLAKNPKKEAADPDPLRLYITGFGTGTKEQDLYKLFPKAQDITLPVRKRDNLPIGYAFLVFATEEQCKAAHDKGQGAKVNGQGLVVLYAKKRTQNQLKKDKKRAEKSKAPKNEKKKDKDQPPAKKAKVELKQEEGDDDDDDDDEDEDDEDSDDEGAAGAAVFGSSEDDDEDEDDDDDDDDEEDDDDDDDDESE